MTEFRRDESYQPCGDREKGKGSPGSQGQGDRGSGPGTELQHILSSLGINPRPDCECEEKARQMDEWGVEGCKKHREEIIAWLRENQGKWGWQGKLLAVLKTVSSAFLVFRINPLNLFPSLVDVAIEEAARQARRAQGG